MSDSPAVEGVAEGQLLWEPSAERKRDATLTRYMSWLADRRGSAFETYDQLWRWSVEELEAFWASVWDFFEVSASKPYEEVLARSDMPGAKWFTGSELNYAQTALAGPDEDTAVVAVSESGGRRELTFGELNAQVAAVAGQLRQFGVNPGDRVVAYMPNVPEAVIALMASASIGAIWSICSPDFGVEAVVDRFEQIEPKVLFVADGYDYNGRTYDRLQNAAAIEEKLPTLEATVLVSNLHDRADAGQLRKVTRWEEIPSQPGPPTFEQVPFDHPLWILYSSGTTGMPKAIVQGHGGILVEHLKLHGFHSDLKRGDRFFWNTTTGWMVWNYVVGALLMQASIVLYDGSPAYPERDAIWGVADAVGATHFGVGAALIQGAIRDQVQPNGSHSYERLVNMGSSGAPLPPEGFKWLYDNVKKDIVIDPVSGGTDVCTAFVGSVPILPVHAGEIPCRCLGVDVQAWNERGEAVTGEVGELVVTKPMPSMPLYFWNDPGNKRYLESYFEGFPGFWRHGDWIEITPRGSAIIYGRSDATLNRGGVRMGTSEFYRVVETRPEIVDSLVVDTGRRGREGQLVLFVVLEEGIALDDDLTRAIESTLRTELSPRHAPDELVAVPEIPRTLNGKKLEVPVKSLLQGEDPDRVVNPDAMQNSDALAPFIEFAASWHQDSGGT